MNMSPSACAAKNIDHASTTLTHTVLAKVAMWGMFGWDFVITMRLEILGTSIPVARMFGSHFKIFQSVAPWHLNTQYVEFNQYGA